MTDLNRRKVDMRSTLREYRRRLHPQQQQAAAQALTASVTELPTWSDAQRIAVYISTDGEIDPEPLADLARKLNKQIFLPVITTQKQLQFRAWQTGSALVSNRYGIPEPSSDAPECAAQDIDIIFLPLVAWDLVGGRLGMGGGYYDRTLTQTGATLRVGLAHTCQQVEAVPREDWDIGMNFTATDTALHCF